MIRYAALRLTLLLVIGALLYLAGMRGILLPVAAVIIAALVAYIFFPRQRHEAAKKLEEIRHREEKPRVPDEDMAVEDSAVEESAVEGASAEEPGEEDQPKPKLD